MAEVNEPTEPNEPEPGEPTEPAEPAPDEEEEEDAENEPAEHEPKPEPETSAGMTERELEAGRVKIEKEETRHRNRIAEIMGEEALSLMPCPLCSDFVSGLIFPVTPPDDVITATLVAVGLGDVRDLEQATDAKQCPECKGKGRTKTGALIGDFASKKCATCKGMGWTRPDGSPVLEEGAPNGAGDALIATNGNDPDVDPLVDALKARGFSVFPPMQVATGA